MKKHLVCTVLLLCFICLTSCGLKEISDKNNIQKTMETIETSIDSKDNDSFKNTFSSTVKKKVSESDIDKIFDIFSSGITYKGTDSENHPATYESIEDDDYVKTLEWHKEFIDNATQKEYIMIINICVENWNEESDIGMKYIIFYDIEQEEEALEWLHSVDEEELFEGVYIYGK